MSTPSGPPRSVVVIGAGLAGLVAARQLIDADIDVTVVDKGRSVGGRLATRRIGDARLDHGAQFFTVRTPAFQQQVDDWLARGLVHVWTRGFADGLGEGSADAAAMDDGHPRYAATHGMNSLAKDLAEGVPVETSTMVFGVRAAGDGDEHRWNVVIDDGTFRTADAVVITSPLPQTFSLLVDMVWSADDEIETSAARSHQVELAEGLFRTEYDRTLGLLCTLDRSPALPPPGAVQRPDGIFGFIADNAAKGISEQPAVTFHADADWSEERWDDDPDDVLAALVEAALPWLGDAVILEAQLKKWRFATPRSIWPEPCYVTGGGTMVLAGDAFAGPRVEGAHNSGLAAAHALTA